MSLRLLLFFPLVAACGRMEPVVSSETSPPEATSRPAQETAMLAVPPPVQHLPDNAVWAAPNPVHFMAGRSERPVLAALGGGKVLAMWTQTHTTAPYQRLWSSQLSNGTWSPAVQVSANGPGSEISLASAGDGDAVAAWLEYTGTSTRQLVVQSWSQGQWSAPKVLSALTWQQGTLMQPVAKVGADGQAVVAWAIRAPAADEYTLYVAARPRGGSFGNGGAIAGALRLGRSAESGAQLDLAVDGQGALLVAWVQETAGLVEVWARRGRATAGSVGPIAWDGARLVATEAKTTSSWAFGLWAGFHAGRFFTGWLKGSDGTGYTLVTRHDRLDGSWDAEAEVGPIHWGSYAAPKLAAAANGDKVLLWREGDDKASRIVARTFDGTLGWGPLTVVAGGLAPRYLGCVDIDARDHDVSIDATGNAVAVWEERIPQPNTQATMKVRSSRLVKGAAPAAVSGVTGWTAPVQLDDSRGRASHPVVAATGQSTAVSLWHVDGPSAPPFLQASVLAPSN